MQNVVVVVLSLFVLSACNGRPPQTGGDPNGPSLASRGWATPTDVSSMPSGTPSPGSPTDGTLKVQIDDPALLAGPGVDVVPLATTRQLVVRFELPSIATGVSWATLRLVSPTGAVHSVRHVPFSTTGATKVPSVDGVPHLVDAAPILRVGPRSALDFVILVGGTNLQRHPQLGTWSIHAVVDGAPASSANATFRFF